MAKYRRGRINDAVAQEMAVKLRDICDPRVVNNFVSITRADVSPDLKTARIYFSAMGNSAEAKAALTGACGLFRHHLAQTLNMRLTPELTFVADNSIEHGAHISKILRDLYDDKTNGATNASADNTRVSEENEYEEEDNK